MDYSKKDIIKILVDSAQKYDKYLANRTFLFIYDMGNQNYKYIEVTFIKNNFKHFTGIETNLEPKPFYEKCLDHRLSLADINKRDDGTTDLKLSRLSSMCDLLSSDTYWGKYNNSHKHIHANCCIGTSESKNDITLVLKRKNTKKKDHMMVPISFLAEQINTVSDCPYGIVAIYCMDNLKRIYMKNLVYYNHQEANYVSEKFDASQFHDTNIHLI